MKPIDMNDCEHGIGPGCPMCETPAKIPTIGGGPSTTHPAVVSSGSDSTAPPKKLGFDYTSLYGVAREGYTIEQNDTLVRWVFEETEDTFWRGRIHDEQSFSKYIDSIAKQYTPAKKKISAEGQELMAKYPGWVNFEVFAAEYEQRFDAKKEELNKACPDCKGTDFVSCDKFPDFPNITIRCPKCNAALDAFSKLEQPRLKEALNIPPKAFGSIR